MKIKVRWQAEDGYVGSRPQALHIDSSEIEPDMDDAELEKLLDDEVQNDFEQKVAAGVMERESVLAQMIAVRDAKKLEG